MSGISVIYPTGLDKIFNRMSPTDGENLLTKIGPRKSPKRIRVFDVQSQFKAGKY
jgi:hypothetical protein